jgi:hypothetical protein
MRRGREYVRIAAEPFDHHEVTEDTKLFERVDLRVLRAFVVLIGAARQARLRALCVLRVRAFLVLYSRSYFTMRRMRPHSPGCTA